VTRARAETEIRLRACAAVGGGKASKGRSASRGIPSRNGMKRDEPQDRKRPANGRDIVEEKTVEVVRNHGDGTRMGMAFPSRRSDEAGRRRSAQAGRETDSATKDDGGAIFGQPHERKPGLRTGWQGPERVGNGVKVRRVACT